MRYLDTGTREPSQALARWLEGVLCEDKMELRIQTGFFSLNGIGILVSFLERGTRDDQITKMLIGSNEGCTLRDDVAGLIRILGIPRRAAHLGVVSFGGAYFHPKTYHVRRSDGSQAAFVGSANLTASGLALHVEAGIALDTREGDSADELSHIASAVDAWFEEKREGLTLIADPKDLDELVESGILALVRPPRPLAEAYESETASRNSRPRLKPLLRLPPVVPRDAQAERGASVASAESPPDLPEEALKEESEEIAIEVLPPALPQLGIYRAFLMSLQRTDVGVGQTTQGTSRRSPEIFIPLAARDADPSFWGWPNQFSADPAKPGKMDRFGVKMRIGPAVFDVNMMTWPDKHDFRLRSENLRSAGNVGDVLYLERSDGSSGFTYYVEVIPEGSARYGNYLALCVNPVKNSKRKWGYV